MHFSGDIGIFFDHMLWDDHPFLSGKVFSVCDVIGRQIDEHNHPGGIECEDGTCLFNIGDPDGINAKADGFTGRQKTSVDPLQESS